MILFLASAVSSAPPTIAPAKMEILRENGIHVVESPAKIGVKVAELLKK